MPTNRLPTKLIRSICERLQTNENHCKISKSLSVSKGTVSNVKHRVLPQFLEAIADGEWVDDTQLTLWMYPTRPTDINFHAISYLSQAGLPIQFIHDHCEWFGLQIPVSYSQLCTVFNQWKTRQPPDSATRCEPGKLCLVRDCGLGFPLYNSANPKDLVYRYDISVCMMPTSGYCRFYLIEQKSQFDRVEALQSFFTSMGAIPEEVDITLASSSKPNLKEFDSRYKTKTTVRTKPRNTSRPGEYQLFEACSWVTEQLKEHGVPGHVLKGTAQVQAILETLTIRWNQQLMFEHDEYIANAFLELDRQHMRTLPEEPFMFSISKEAVVSVDNHIKHGAHHYSVPHQLIGERVELVVYSHKLQVYSNGELAAEHPYHSGKGYSTQDEHMYSGSHWDDERQYSPQRLLRWARKFGRETEKWAYRLMNQAEYPEQMFRAIITYLKKHEDSALLAENQCRRANQNGWRNPSQF